MKFWRDLMNLMIRLFVFGQCLEVGGTMLGVQVILEKFDVLRLLSTSYTGIFFDELSNWANSSFSTFEPEVLDDVRPYLRAVVGLWSILRDFDSSFIDTLFRIGDSEYSWVSRMVKGRTN